MYYKFANDCQVTMPKPKLCFEDIINFKQVFTGNEQENLEV